MVVVDACKPRRRVETRGLHCLQGLAIVAPTNPTIAQAKSDTGGTFPRKWLAPARRDPYGLVRIERYSSLEAEVQVCQASVLVDFSSQMCIDHSSGQTSDKVGPWPAQFRCFVMPCKAGFDRAIVSSDPILDAPGGARKLEKGWFFCDQGDGGVLRRSDAPSMPREMPHAKGDGDEEVVCCLVVRFAATF